MNLRLLQPIHLSHYPWPLNLTFLPLFLNFFLPPWPLHLIFPPWPWASPFCMTPEPCLSPCLLNLTFTQWLLTLSTPHGPQTLPSRSIQSEAMKWKGHLLPFFIFIASKFRTKNNSPHSSISFLFIWASIATIAIRIRKIIIKDMRSFLLNTFLV